MKTVSKFIMIIFSFVILFSTNVIFSQTIPSSLTGEDLRNWLKQNYYNGKHSQLGYTNARRYMYNYIDNDNNKIICVYSGYQKTWSYGGTGTNPQPINCEHTIPQSFFGKSEPMKSDIHHLFPTYGNWNSTRSNHPFAEINDNVTVKWMHLGSYINYIPDYNIDLYSEYANSLFEPREDHKGNVARAIFYFYTMYPTQAGDINRVANTETLYQWHIDDPVDYDEQERNDLIEYYQGNRNPYIDHPEIVDEAWLLSGSGGGSGSEPGSANELFISEYIEGSSYNKCIEIANFTGSSVNLSDYAISRQLNGSGNFRTKLYLSGTLADGEVYVIVHSSANSSLKSKANKITGADAILFNGNDPVGLFKNNSLIDIVGNFNEGSSNFAKDVTLVRDSAVDSPTTNFSFSQWSEYSQNTFSYLGYHLMN